MRNFHRTAIMLVSLWMAATFIGPSIAAAASAEEINRDVKAALDSLYAKSPTAFALGEKAKGILVFPGIVKGGFLVGGQYGEGALVAPQAPGTYRVLGYYSSIQGSFGLQAGLQQFGYAMFFMSEGTMDYLHGSGGWELGTGPTIVVVDLGAAKSLSTSTLQSNIYAFFFDQKGLMGGLGLQGTKVTQIEK